MLVFGAVNGTDHNLLVFRSEAVEHGDIVLVHISVEAVDMEIIMRVLRIIIIYSS